MLFFEHISMAIDHRRTTMTTFALRTIICFLSLFVTGSMAFQKAGHLARLGRQSFARAVRPTSFLLRAVQEEVDPGVVQGTDLRVAIYPHPALRARNELVTPEELEDGSMTKLAKEMLLVMYAAEGVGLAAPQVGVNKRLMVYNQSGSKTAWLDEV
jgi:hypothetical protein